jgi:hypothetical protein
VELRRVVDNALICKAPCDEQLMFRESDQFVLGGPGLTNSDRFQFRPRDGEVKLRVTSGDLLVPILGGTLAGAGGVVALYGGLSFALDSAFQGTFCDGDQACIAGDRSRTDSARTVMLVGLGLAAVGGLILLLTRRTTYSVEE